MAEQPRSLVTEGSALPNVPTVACASCGHANRPGAKFCGACAAVLADVRSCLACGTPNPQGQKFCDACGHALSHGGTVFVDPRRRTPRHLAERLLAEQAALEALASPEGERKTITALFVDIKGSVELMQDLDPEDARNLVDPAIELMIEAVHEFEGYVDKSTGDGIVALFGAPIAHEDHAQRAVRAALRIQEQIARYAEMLRREHRSPLQVRIGLNSGEMVLRSIRKDDLHADYTPIGHSTNIAARMESLAAPGTILVSESTYRLTEGYFDFKALGPVRARGVRQPVQAYEVVGVGSLRTKLDRAARRGLARFVGRQDEMRHLGSALELAQAGHGQVVAVVAEPGIGKSRLFHELKLSATADWLILETSAVAHGRSYPYFTLLELLREYFRIAASDDARTQRSKIADSITNLDHSLAEALPYLYHLLGVSELTSSLQQMDAGIRRRRTFDALKRLLLRETLRQPLLLMFQDLQWVDGETQAFLDVLVESVVTARILLLVNYRPEYEHAWGNRTFYTQLPLNALTRDSAYEMLTALLGDKIGLDPLKQLILEKTEGNPFFMEEIVQALFDRGVLVRRRSGVALTTSLTRIQIPTTVQGVLAARIDRLDSREKALLQTLAVIGRAFSFSLMERVVGDAEDDLQGLLAALQAAEFIYEQPAFPEPQYTFKHALTQDVAYGSLLTERRRALHERTAQAIEALFRARLEDHYGELAHHYRQSGNTGKAVEYLRRAGQQAVQRSAHAEAVSHLTTALELLETLPASPQRTQQELAIQVALGAPLALTKGYAAPEVGRARTRAQELCRQVGETPQLFPVLFGLWAFNLVRGELRTADTLSTQLLSLAEAVRDQALRVEAHRAVGATLFFLGDFVRANQHLEEGIALYDIREHGAHALLYGQDPGVSCLSYGAVVLWHLGYPDRALKTAEQALTLAQQVAHPFSMAFALDMAAAVHQFRGEARLTRERAERAIVLSTEQGFPLWSAYGTVLRGWAAVHGDKRKTQARHLHDGLTAWRATGAQIVGPFLLGMLADAYAALGEPQNGLPLVAEALALVQSSGEAWWEPELHRLQGVLLLESQPSTAERCFGEAITSARRRGAKGLELRATTSLGRLLARRGTPAEAGTRLRELYGSFTEGLDTIDLAEARSLLEEHSAG
ncbi:MAG: adenylate/guanylate cyclase domain-containing protein [Candidatus Binatia bacterium]